MGICSEATLQNDANRRIIFKSVFIKESPSGKVMITEITRQDIFDKFINGINLIDKEETLAESLFSTKPQTFYYNSKMPYYGRLDELSFLKRLYRLDNLPSDDHRFKTFEQDFIQHRITNKDWEDGWVFKDIRFPLGKGSDQDLLDFLCMVFSPSVRLANPIWEEYLVDINALLKKYGYELYENEKISGHSSYKWRIFSDDTLLTTQIENLKTDNFNSRYIENQLKIMLENMDNSSDIVIGKAKELIETCCKTILESEYSNDDSLPLQVLVGNTCKHLGYETKNERYDTDEKKITG